MKLKEVKAELKLLQDEEGELDAPEELKSFIELTEYKPKTGEAEIVDEILTLL